MDFGDQPTIDDTSRPSSGPSSYTLPARYEPLEKLGEGGMGVVVKARDRETGELLAVKLLRPEIAADPQALERFKNELRLARKITHKNVCRIHEFQREGGLACIAMEFVDGESLRHVLNRRQGISICQGLEWSKQFLSGLAEAHAQDVTHRDLKPENLMITRTGELKIMDFGIARTAESTMTRMGAMIGTPAYMSPEQAEGNPVDVRSDIYSAGLILYEIFSGSMCFRAETPIATAMMQVRAKPRPPREIDPDMPARIERVILKCIEKAPADRYASVAAVAAALDEADVTPRVSSAPHNLREIALPVHMTRWTRSDWVLSAAAIAAMAVFLFLFDHTLPYGIYASHVPASALEDGKKIIEKFAPGTTNPDCRLRLGTIRGKNFPNQVFAQSLNVVVGTAPWSPGWIVNCDQSGVVVDAQGKALVVFWRPSQKPSANSFGTPSEAAALVQKAVLDCFGINLAGTAPIPLTFDPTNNLWTRAGTKEIMGGGNIIPTVWERKVEKSAYQERIQAFAQGGQLYEIRREAAARFLPDADFPFRNDRWEIAGMWREGFLALLALASFVLAVFRGLYRKTVPVLWILSALVALAATLATSDAFPHPPVFIVVLLAAFGFLSPAYDYLLRILPDKLKTTLEPAERPAALSVLRGAFVGLIIMAVQLSALLALGNRRLASASTDWFEALGGNPAAAITFALAAPLVGAWMLIAWPVAIFYRVRTNAPMILANISLLWIFGAVSFPGLSIFPTLPYFLWCGVQGLVFGAVFLRYDLLTTWIAMFTVETWLIAFALYRYFEATQIGPNIAVIALWLVIVLAAAASWLRPQFRRVADVFG